jgi:uncharacterized protein (DUF1330 family)
MSAYLVYNYTVTNAEEYQAYPPAAIPTLAGHDVEVLVADYESEAKEGSPEPVAVVLRFPSKEAARAWYESSEYQAIMHHLTDNGHAVDSSDRSIVECRCGWVADRDRPGRAYVDDHRVHRGRSRGAPGPRAYVRGGELATRWIFAVPSSPAQLRVIG